MTHANNVIKIVAAGTAASILAAGTASAEAADVAGVYVGAGFGAYGGLLGDDEMYGIGDASASGFVGYNFVSGDLVYGIEAEAWTETRYEAYDDYGVNGLVDIKARLGKTFGNTFIYGTVGYAQTNYVFADRDLTAVGYSIGGGLETLITSNMFVGVDLTTRFFTDTGSRDKIQDTPLTTVAVRAGLRF